MDTETQEIIREIRLHVTEIKDITLRLDESIRGNGKVGIERRLDRVEHRYTNLVKVLGVIGAAIMGVALQQLVIYLRIGGP